MMRLLADENFHGVVVRHVLIRCPGLDLVRVQDVGLSGATDPEVLAWAAANDRIVLTHDHRTMPDDALFVEAERGTLRQNLAPQVQRMLADPKSSALVENFGGQWLQRAIPQAVKLHEYVIPDLDNIRVVNIHQRCAFYL